MSLFVHEYTYMQDTHTAGARISIQHLRWWKYCLSLDPAPWLTPAPSLSNSCRFSFIPRHVAVFVLAITNGTGRTKLKKGSSPLQGASTAPRASPRHADRFCLLCPIWHALQLERWRVVKQRKAGGAAGRQGMDEGRVCWVTCTWAARERR